VWIVRAKPEGRNTDGFNTGGLAIVLVDLDDDWREVEVARVAFDRTKARDPEVPFVDAFIDAIERAEEAAQLVNDTLDAEAQAVRDKNREQRERIKELLSNNEEGEEGGLMT
jgi:hypothetical protein